jgi:hypothetical protein
MRADENSNVRDVFVEPFDSSYFLRAVWANRKFFTFHVYILLESNDHSITPCELRVFGNVADAGSLFSGDTDQLDC